MDRFLDPDAKREAWKTGGEPNRAEFEDEPVSVHMEADRLSFVYNGRIVLRTHSVPVRLLKDYISLGPKFQVRARIRNDGRRRISLLHGSEWNLRQIPDEISLDGSRVILCRGRLAASPLSKADLWMRPLLTLSQSEKDFDTIHQGYGLLWLQPVELGPGEEADLAIEFGEADAV